MVLCVPCTVTKQPQQFWHNHSFRTKLSLFCRSATTPIRIIYYSFIVIILKAPAGLSTLRSCFFQKKIRIARTANETLCFNKSCVQYLPSLEYLTAWHQLDVKGTIPVNTMTKYSSRSRQTDIPLSWIPRPKALRMIFPCRPKHMIQLTKGCNRAHTGSYIY